MTDRAQGQSRAAAIEQALLHARVALEEVANILRPKLPSLADNVIGAHIREIDAALALPATPERRFGLVTRRVKQEPTWDATREPPGRWHPHEYYGPDAYDRRRKPK